MMSGSGWRRRRAVIVVSGIALGLVLMLIAPDLAPQAGALIGNPGDVTVSLDLSVRTPTLDLATSATKAAGTVTDDGIINVPQSGVTFVPIDVKDFPTVSGPGPDPTDTSTSAPTTTPSSTDVTVQLVATSPLQGVLDPTTGAAFLVGELREMWTPAGSSTSCPVGPFKVVVETDRSGGRLYKSTTGTVTMVDTNVAIDRAPTGHGCDAIAAAIDGAQSLPVTTTTTTTTIVPAGGHPHPAPPPAPDSKPPVPSVVVSMRFAPAPIGISATVGPPQLRRAALIPIPPPPAPATATPAPPPRFHRRYRPRPANMHRRAHEHRVRKLSKAERAKIAAALRRKARLDAARAKVRPERRPVRTHARRRTARAPAAARLPRPILRVPQPVPTSGGGALLTNTLLKPGPSAWSVLVQILGVLALIVSVAMGLALIAAEMSNHMHATRSRRLSAAHPGRPRF